jgi:RND superfamily putative drug exporter
VLERYARFIVGHRRAVLVTSLVGLLVAAAAFVDLGNRVTMEGFVVRDSESHRAKQLLARDFEQGLPNLVLVVGAKSGSVDDPQIARVGQELTRRLARERGVANVVSYWTPQHPRALRSTRGNRALIVARITGDDRTVDERIRALEPRYRDDDGPVHVDITGNALFFKEGVDLLQEDLTHSELVTAPITLIALLVIFGSLVAATIPLGVSVFVVLGTGLVLWLVSHLTPISSFSLFFTTVLGLGLAIDYSLFIISRFREELAARGDPETAAVATVKSAGHTVLFSAVAIGLALAGLLLMPLQFMRSLGYAGLGTAIVAGAAGLVLLPALLAGLGERINRVPVGRGATRANNATGFWYRAARRVMRRPRLVLGVSLLALLAVGSHALQLDPGLTDDRLLGSNAETRRTGDLVRKDFSSREGTPVPIALPGVDPRRPAARRDLDAYARRVARVEGVVRVDTATGSYTRSGHAPLPPRLAADFTARGSTYLSVASSAEPLSDAGRRQIRALRALPSPFPEVLVTGEAAVAKDVTDEITAALPVSLVFVFIASFLALMVQFRSVIAPLLSLGLSLVSMSVLYAFIVFVFQDGHLSGLLGFTATGTMYINIAVLLFCFAYGLSLDYQVFLYSRIREEWERSRDHARAIAYGLGRSGWIMSAAAILVAIVFLGSGLLSSSFFGISFGIGLGLIVLLDAFVIRGTLFPAAMKLIGPRIWWAPAWLRRETPSTPALARLRLLEDEARLLLTELSANGHHDGEVAALLAEFDERSRRWVGRCAPGYAQFYAVALPAPQDAPAQLGHRARQLDFIAGRLASGSKQL